MVAGHSAPYTNFKWVQTYLLKNMGVFAAPGLKILHVHIFRKVEPRLVGEKFIIKSVHSTLCETKKPMAKLHTLRLAIHLSHFAFREYFAIVRAKHTTKYETLNVHFSYFIQISCLQKK